MFGYQHDSISPSIGIDTIPLIPEQANYRIRFSARSIRIIRIAAFVTEKEKVEITTAGKNDHSLIVSAIAIPTTPAITKPR